jgi:outer membrane lipoprotein SlyB
MAPMQPEAAARAKTKSRCAECGVIVSMREIVGHDDDSSPGAAGGAAAVDRDETRVESAMSHEIVVRMADGSRRVINHASPASWRPGERVIVINGTNPSNR